MIARRRVRQIFVYIGGGGGITRRRVGQFSGVMDSAESSCEMLPNTNICSFCVFLTCGHL